MEPYFTPWIFAAIGVISLVLNGGLAWLVWVRKPGEEASRAVQSTTERVADLLRQHQAELERRLQDQHGRISELEVTVRHMPSADEVRRLDGLVKVIDERTTGMQEGMRGMRASLGRIESWIVEMRFLGSSRPTNTAPDTRL